MSFYLYDISFLVVFGLAVIFFLVKNKDNLKREGVFFLYRTKLGIKVINFIGTKFKKTLSILKYFIIFVGYILMITMLYLLFQIVYIYFKFPEVVRAIKAPPLLPLIPYVTEIFDVGSILPPFYFTYWILAIIIIAVSHEFAHGILAKYNNVKIKSTGFGFLGPLLAAFVEPDEKKLQKKSKTAQLSVLAAGSFANVVVSGIFILLMWGFFSIAFMQSGATFNTYTYEIVNFSSIKIINNISLNDRQEMINFVSGLGNESLINVTADKLYVIQKETFLTELNSSSNSILLFDNAPAINAGMKGNIIEFNHVKIKNGEILREELRKYSLGDNVLIETELNNQTFIYNIILAANPQNKSIPFIGIGVIRQSGGVLSGISQVFAFFIDESTYYKERFNGFSIFIYNLLWWIFMINIAVALFNMLPLGIFDGGRVFYLTMLAVSRSEKFAKKSFKTVTYLLLFLFLLLMFLWFISIAKI